MRVSSYAVARPQYYDRNAVTSSQYGSPTAAGGDGPTTSFTTTVAAGKKLLVEYSEVSLLRSTVATVNTRNEAYVRVLTNTSVINLARVDGALANTLNVFTQDKSAGAVTLYAAESINGIFRNTDTGGTVEVFLSYKGTMFDA